VMEARKRRGVKVYTSAYRIPQRNEKCKAVRTVKVLDHLWNAVANDGYTLPWEDDEGISLSCAHKWLMQFPEWGGFLAYEAVTDWRHTRYLCNAPDIRTWANAGPGASVGICRLMGVDLETKFLPGRQLEIMRETYRWVCENRDRRILPTLEM